MIDAAKLVAAHQVAQGKAASEAGDEQAGASIDPNPDRTYTGQPRVRLYVAMPRGSTA